MWYNYSSCVWVFFSSFILNPPGLSIFAFPIGMRKSLDWDSSDMSNATPYISSFSKNTTERVTMWQSERHLQCILNIRLIMWGTHQGCRLGWLISEGPWRLQRSRDWPPSDRDSVRTRQQSTGNAEPPRRPKRRWVRGTRSGRTGSQQTCSTS